MLTVIQFLAKPMDSVILCISLIQIASFGLCDFVAQFILVRMNCVIHLFYSSNSSKIYRCWIVWGCNIRVVVIPSILAFAFLSQSTIFFD